MTPLAKIRKDRKITQSDLAEAVGCDQTTISKLENGEPASSKLAREIAKYFGHAVTEMQLIYPKDYELPDDKDAS